MLGLDLDKANQTLKIHRLLRKYIFYQYVSLVPAWSKCNVCNGIKSFGCGCTIPFILSLFRSATKRNAMHPPQESLMFSLTWLRHESVTIMGYLLKVSTCFICCPRLCSTFKKYCSFVETLTNGQFLTEYPVTQSVTKQELLPAIGKLGIVLLREKLVAHQFIILLFLCSCWPGFNVRV